jgi:hypothetical protein
MQQFITSKASKFKSENEDKLLQLKKQVNSIINTLYEEVAQFAFSLDKYRIPVNGIDNPELENPVNLFQRQLKIEQLSFELAHEKYKQALGDLMKIEKGD